MPHTRKQRYSTIVAKVRAQVRFRKLRDLSDAGETLADAAATLGMTVAGVKSMLYRETGSWTWPIADDQTKG